MDNFIEQLQEASDNNDFDIYKKIVDAHGFSNLEYDFWCETFYEGSENEILFWINYDKRILRVTDLILINFEYDYLFDIGINKQGLNFDNVIAAAEYLSEQYSEYNSPNQIIIDRVSKIMNHINFPKTETEQFKKQLGF